MNKIVKKSSAHKHIWQQANKKLLPSLLLSGVGVALSLYFKQQPAGTINRMLLLFIGVGIFIIFATASVRIGTKAINRMISNSSSYGEGRAASLQLLLRIVGYVVIGLVALSLVGIPIGNLLLGGAAVGIILGVAAQQALANFFASIVLSVSQPFSVGEYLEINSGALGGSYEGKVTEIGLTHTRLLRSDGQKILFPNAAILLGAAIVKGQSVTKAK